MGTEWLEPLGPEFTAAWPHETLGASLLLHADGLPDLRGVAVALIGVPEQRAAAHDIADSVRRALYPLFWGSWDLRVADLGNLRPGRDRVDTMVAVEELAVEVLQYGCIPVFLGADSDWPLAVYRAFGRLERTINACFVNNRIALGDDQVLPDRSNLLAQMLTMKPFRLFHVSHLAHQSYFVAQSVLDLAEKMHLEVHRVGELLPIQRAEPWIRDADLVVVHNAAVRAADAPAQHEANPNGLTGESFCAILRYAGYSDKLAALCAADFVGSRDLDGQNAHLWAQGIWYFLDGVAGRVGDFPLRAKAEYLRFTVLLPNETGELVFYKSPWSQRWWIEVPNHPGEDARHSLVPCSMDDYSLAQNGEIPAVWWRIVRRGI
jgi:hypothetical protein